jgi:Domain of unknown function (DUF2017)
VSGFRTTSGGVTARFARPEAAIIRDLVTQVADLIGGTDAGEPAGPADLPGAAGQAAADRTPRGGAPGVSDPQDVAGQIPVPGVDELTEMLGLSENTELPDDPILARLLPDGYTDDPDAAQDFRRFTESGLRSAKVAAAQTVLVTLPPRGGRVRLSSGQAESWLRALNDVRLALGVRLGVTDDFDGLSEDVRPDDTRYAYVQVYQWLAYLQESLIMALS